MIKRLLSIAAAAILLISCAPKEGGKDQASGQPDRTVLPIKEPTYAPITELDARNAKAPPRFQVKAPERAPNVVVLIDDIGFGHSSAFGGPINMPALERLAADRFWL